jgi:hypothetical protein
MRILVDLHGVPWDEAWRITVGTFSYTNHTLLPEALETWPVDLFGRVLPRHLEIIYRINTEHVEAAKLKNPSASDSLESISLIDEHHGRKLRMGHLAFVGSHRTNGVSALHTNLMRKTVFGSSVLGCAGKTISPSLLFLSQTSAGKRSWRLHRVSPCREQFLDLTGGYSFASIHAAWDTGLIGLTWKLRPPCRTPQTMRAILLASAIASLKRLSRRAAASIQDLRPCFSQLCGRSSMARAA